MTDPSRARGLFADAYAASVTRYGARPARNSMKSMEERFESGAAAIAWIRACSAQLTASRRP